MDFYFIYLHRNLNNQTLKYSSYIHETKKMIGKDIIINVGETIKFKDIEKISDRAKITEFLKNKTYDLGDQINE